MSSLMAMPLIIVNLGGEMMYVLNQRLEAQAIPQEKAHQVMDEVIGAMFNATFVDALFKPHPVYTFRATKLIFQKLAHCSIMKLNETSMGKLYDLMTMVFKFQILASRSPRDIIEISLKHIDNMKDIVSPSLRDTLEACAERVKTTYEAFSTGQLWALRQTLLEFLQGRNVKISLLLQENFQTRNGKFIVNLDGPCPCETPLPGKIRYYDVENSISRESEADLGVFKVAQPIEYDEESYRETQSLLGDNLYAMFRGGASAKPEASNQAEEDQSANEEKDSAEAKSSAEEEKSVSGADEMNILANLIIPPSASTSRKAPSFRLNLFGAANEDFGIDPFEKSRPTSNQPVAESKHPDRGVTMKFDAKASHRSLGDRMKDLDMDDHAPATSSSSSSSSAAAADKLSAYGGRRLEPGASKTADEDDDMTSNGEADDDDDDDDDLLDLMDQATAVGSHK
ncbi:Protein OSCP1 [Hondaea fermentalgiana]|uniref:Protein OSCP1 n=1 Tax=Hondaea fermentalgiana TaxID=2315210 RepID=A0A2R5G659_9STRA|nr:Protein OSCP1 [Hondaea fermentalgiana]|eukprot:GBG26542.1 Protein OSCP1 [Hondaea fermentalgiana]